MIFVITIIVLTNFTTFVKNPAIMLNYGGGIAKTNKSLKDMNKKGRSLMGAREMPAVKAANPQSSIPKKKKK